MFYKIAFLFVILAYSALALSEAGNELLLQQSFANFKTKFNKKYNEGEEAVRFERFIASVERVAKMNEGEEEPIFGITKFADLTPQEFKSTYLNYKPNPNKQNEEYTVMKDESTLRGGKMSTPTNWDWRDEGVVTDVKDQGNCGSCWAFSTAQTIESQWANAGNPLTVFSEQQLVSCDPNDYGCRGGDPPNAYKYVLTTGGLATEESYPYTSGSVFPPGSGKCKDFKVEGGAIDGWEYLTQPCFGTCMDQDEDELAKNLANGGAASICVSAYGWQDYVGGVMTTLKSGCGFTYDSLDHCVQLVGYNGYGTDDAYWIVRNSWADDWGVDGYIHLAFGNTCGVADEVTLPSIKS